MQHGGIVGTDVVGASPLINYFMALIGCKVINILWSLPTGFYVLVCKHDKPHMNRAEVIKPPHSLVFNVVHRFTSCRPLINTLRTGVK